MLYFVVLLVAVASPSYCKLYPVESGRSGKQGQELVEGMVFCPTDHFSQGFSILCMADVFVEWAKFFIDDEEVHFDDSWPFYISGDKKGKVRKWRKWGRYRGQPVTVKCELSDGAVTAATITFSCEGEKQQSTPSATSAGPSQEVSSHPPGTMLLRPSGLITGPGTPVLGELTFCDKMYRRGFTVECVGSPSSTNAKFYVNRVRIKTERVKPYFIAGDRNGFAFEWKPKDVAETFELRCVLSDGASSTATVTVTCDDELLPSDEQNDEGDEQNDRGDEPKVDSDCVVIDARGTMLGRDWVEVADGVTFRPDDKEGGTQRPGAFPLYYYFTAPITSRYAFVLEMTTSHGTEHNDVWAKFPDGGFQLMRKGELHEDSKKGEGYIKVYHNKRGRAALSVSVDFDPQSISTREILQKEKEYEVLLSGRSSRVTIHNILFFPCEGTDCHRGARPWKNKLEECLDLTE